MKTLNKTDLKDIISGSNLLGTGGGGTISSALKIIDKIKKPVIFADFNDLTDKDFVCTVFGVGGTQNCNPILASRKALTIFQNVINKKVTALISVEVGPMAIANTAFLASELKIPLLDSDIVGLRSSPEVFLETISIKNISRTPCSICDDKGNSAILLESQNLQQLESFFRNFAISAGGDAFVAGYPLNIKTLKKIAPGNSITISKETGIGLKKLRKNKIVISNFCQQTKWILIDTGKIEKEEKDNSKGFTQGFYEIKSGKNIYKVIFKNENIVVLKNSKVLFTCPDSISLLNLDIFQGINNFETKKNKNVAILGKKAIPIWRTEKGKNLFSPRNLGLNYNQKLL